ncbi:hypothetical protein DPMN_135476 [Dreissena polymorpha]|uniref:Uncharacterized protein n=1 Tax=Dreissena polymorpha TaxID=45954 RepID=A0A9D4FY70_DREPO|nr:hypothetical protein DPMN_135476 [Dreissena polymorpha]
MNLLTGFHEDRTINVASRVLTRFYYSHIRKNAPPLGSHVFHAKVTIFKLIQDIIETNLLTKFHEDSTINVASRVFTRNKQIPLLRYGSGHKSAGQTDSWTDGQRQNNIPPPLAGDKNAPPLLTNLLTKLHEDWTINVASRVLTRKTAPPPSGHFHDDWGKIVTSREFTRNTAPTPGGHTNILTKLHEDWESNVTSTVFTSFELSPGINGTNVLTKFHEDQTMNVASRVFTRQNVDDRRTTDQGQKAITKAHHDHIVLR